MNLIQSENKNPVEHWIFAANTSELSSQKKLVIRPEGKQIALFNTDNGIFACDNRCPHEGYPLAEGSLDNRCVLTCNWHNWKFNLHTGENLFGGDSLRIYETDVRHGEVWINLTEPPYEERYSRIMSNLDDAFQRNVYDRIAREIARLQKIGADPLDALRKAVHWSYGRMEFGFTHAYAGMADWLTLYHEFKGDEETRLVCLVESFSHTAFDVLREPEYPYPDSIMEFDADEFLVAIEQENEAHAIAMVHGGLNQGLGFSDFEQALSQSALAHYNDFGHSLIYVNKTGQLIEYLGKEVEKPLLFALVRALVYATREDRIPEFRYYDEALRNWGQGEAQPAPELWQSKGINSALKATVSCSHRKPEEIFPALVTACGVSMLGFDIAQQSKHHVSVSGNINWLDFTHGLTFANAVHHQCQKFPQLWPMGLLQMACFTGRNSAFSGEADLQRWGQGDIAEGMNTLLQQLLDHGQDEHIVSVHLLKTFLAVREELVHLDEECGRYLYAALNRFFNSPLKRRQTRRTAYQSLKFIEKE